MKIYEKCTECRSDDLVWWIGKVNHSGVLDGRLRMHDISIYVYQGCMTCSETLNQLRPSEFFALFGIDSDD